MEVHYEGTLADTLGITFFPRTEEFTFIATMAVTPQVCQPYGRLHGGAVLALAETLAGHGSIALCTQGELPVGQQVSGNHLHAARKGETVQAVATLLHKGRSTHVWNVEVCNEQGIPVSTVRVTNFILPRKPESDEPK